MTASLLRGAASLSDASSLEHTCGDPGHGLGVWSALRWPTVDRLQVHASKC
jgi:hypothetical protein